jgi:periplasmic divalent cation tolerance protein
VKSVIIAFTTVAKRADARKLATKLVSEGLAACVQITPIESVYNWKGGVCREREFLLTLKAGASKAKALERRVKALHPYELPEWLCLGAKASKEYAKWAQ